MMRINESLSLIKGLMRFSTQNNDCHNVGNLNSNSDDLKELISISKQQNLTMLRMQISETAAVVHKFIGFLISHNGTISCTLTNSLENVQYLLAQNTFRIHFVLPFQTNSLKYDGV